MTDASEPPTVGDGQATAPLPPLDPPDAAPLPPESAAADSDRPAAAEPGAAEPPAAEPISPQPTANEPLPARQPDAASPPAQATAVQPAVDAPSPLAAQPAAATAAAAAQQPAPDPDPAPAPRRPGFRERGRMRRRLRYLRKLRELLVRDLGGLVFDLRRFERKRDDLIAQKVDQIRAADDELRALERALDERRDLRDVREPGVGGTCPRCFAIHGSTDRFCSSCGAALGGAVQGPAQVPPAAPGPPAQ